MIVSGEPSCTHCLLRPPLFELVRIGLGLCRSQALSLLHVFRRDLAQSDWRMVEGGDKQSSKQVLDEVDLRTDQAPDVHSTQKPCPFHEIDTCCWNLSASAGFVYASANLFRLASGSPMTSKRQIRPPRTTILLGVEGSVWCLRGAKRRLTASLSPTGHHPERRHLLIL